MHSLCLCKVLHLNILASVRTVQLVIKTFANNTGSPHYQIRSAHCWTWHMKQVCTARSAFNEGNPRPFWPCSFLWEFWGLEGVLGLLCSFKQGGAVRRYGDKCKRRSSASGTERLVAPVCPWRLCWMTVFQSRNVLWGVAGTSVP